MASPDFFLSRNPERRELPTHPLIETARTVQREIWRKYDSGHFDEMELSDRFKTAAGQLTLQANRGKYIGQSAILSGESLHRPDPLESFGSVPALTTDADQAFHYSPSVRGNFQGFNYTMDGNSTYHLTAQILAQPEIHTVDGHLSRHAWCPVDDASIEFVQEQHEAEIERTLGVIDRLHPPQKTATAIEQLDMFVRQNTESSPWPLRDSRFLFRLAERAAILSNNPHFGVNTQLSNATLDLFAARLRLPRLVSLQANKYWEVPPDTQTPQRLPASADERSEGKDFTLVQPHLVLHPVKARFASLCFALLQHDTTLHIPLQSVTKIQEHEQ